MSRSDSRHFAKTREPSQHRAIDRWTIHVHRYSILQRVPRGFFRLAVMAYPVRCEPHAYRATHALLVRHRMWCLRATLGKHESARHPMTLPAARAPAQDKAMKDVEHAGMPNFINAFQIQLVRLPPIASRRVRCWNAGSPTPELGTLQTISQNDETRPPNCRCGQDLVLRQVSCAAPR